MRVGKPGVSQTPYRGAPGHSTIRREIFERTVCIVPRFERVEELFARNAGVYGTLDESLEKMQLPSFADVYGEFFVVQDMWVVIIRDSGQFVAWVTKKVRELRIRDMLRARGTDFIDRGSTCLR